MSTYKARALSNIIHAVYDHEEVYTEHRGPEDWSVCGLSARAFVIIEAPTVVTCLWCISIMNTSQWDDIHSDPDETMDIRQRWQR